MMSLGEVVEHISIYAERRKFDNKEYWRGVRRLCFVFQRTMGAKINREEELWQIDEGKEVTKDKLKEWENELKRMGKWRTRS